MMNNFNCVETSSKTGPRVVLTVQRPCNSTLRGPAATRKFSPRSATRRLPSVDLVEMRENEILGPGSVIGDQ